MGVHHMRSILSFAARPVICAAALLSGMSLAQADCKSLLADFDKAVTAKSLKDAKTAEAAIAIDLTCFSNAAQIRKRRIDFELALVDDPSNPLQSDAEKEKALVDAAQPIESWRASAKLADFRMVLGAAAALLLLGSFGPQGAYNLTGSSQFARLQDFLTKEKILEDGKLVSTLPKLPYEKLDAGRSILFSLNNVNQLARLRPLLGPEFDLSPRDNNYTLLSDLQNKLGFSSGPQPESIFHFFSQMPVDHVWPSSVRVIGPLSINENSTASPALKDSEFSLKNDQLSLTAGGQSGHIAGVDILTALKKIDGVASNNNPVAVVDVDDKFSLLVVNADGDLAQDGVLHSMTFWIVVKQ